MIDVEKRKGKELLYLHAFSNRRANMQTQAKQQTNLLGSIPSKQTRKSGNQYRRSHHIPQALQSQSLSEMQQFL